MLWLVSRPRWAASRCSRWGTPTREFRPDTSRQGSSRLGTCLRGGTTRPACRHRASIPEGTIQSACRRRAFLRGRQRTRPGSLCMPGLPSQRTLRSCLATLARRFSLSLDRCLRSPHPHCSRSQLVRSSYRRTSRGVGGTTTGGTRAETIGRGTGAEARVSTDNRSSKTTTPSCSRRPSRRSYASNTAR